MKNVVPNSIERKFYIFRTDENGFIKGSLEDYIDPDLKIVFLGGSTTECLYVDEQFRFPFLVRKELESALKLKINTYNGGRSANESMHSLNILLNKVLPLKPNIVVMMHNINDLVILRNLGSYWYKNSLKSHVQTSKNVFTRYQFPENNHAIDFQDMLKEFKANLETFIAIAKIRNITPVLMTQANKVKNDDNYHMFNQAIRDVAKLNNVLMIDLAKEIPSKDEYLFDSYHFTEKGSKLAAKIISKNLTYAIH